LSGDLWADSGISRDLWALKNLIPEPVIVLSVFRRSQMKKAGFCIESNTLPFNTELNILIVYF
jgi:hypothetical protein